MKQLLIAALFVFPSVAYCQAIPFYQRGPIASLTASGTYISGENLDGHNHSLWGWSATPEFNFTRHFGMEAEVANYYESAVSPGERRLLLAAGPRYTFYPIHKVRPFVFAEAGEMRLTVTRSTYRDWDPVTKTGVGFEYYLPRSVSFTIVPAEWIAHSLDGGGWRNDFSARAGFTINFFARHSEK
jgi:hypothetical protein